ncbi:MAG: 50S ribosomal protein L10 [Desulfobacterales bacterium]|nr:50S ribosomal protein L10 [Desulfobacterales bacterium]
MILEKKKKIAENLHDRLLKSKIVLLVENKGLNVKTITDLRRELRKAGVEFQVVKNTLLTRAAEGTGVTALKSYFKGPNAVVINYDDPIIPAKQLTKFVKDNELLKIKAGILNGRILDENAIKTLSKLPSREILISQVLSVFVTVPTSLVRALSDVPRRLLNVLSAIERQKKEGQ